MITLSAEARHALQQVRSVALSSLNRGGGTRPASRPFSVSNRGLARRFELMSDAEILTNIRESDSDVAHVVFRGLHEVLYGVDQRLRDLTSELIGPFVTLGAAAAAALQAVDHFERDGAAAASVATHTNRIAQYLDDAGV